jgi:mannose-6-phosphate isomerase-like protein (cupin superfamily)
MRVRTRVALEDALRKAPGPGNLAAEIARFGELELEFYQPRGSDTQQPHTRDEIYVIARGTGTFECAGERDPFAPGDMLFVPARVEHRFEDFSSDFAAWVLFFGPEGGTRAGDS